MTFETTYVGKAVDLVLDGQLDAAVEVAPGMHIRAEVVCRAVLPQVIENLEGRERFLVLVESYGGVA